MWGAKFLRARAQGADFTFVQAQGADFRFAQAKRADFSYANAQGADFSGATFNSETRFTAAKFFLAAVKSCHFGGTEIRAAQVAGTFGDATTTLPDGMARPVHWPDWDLPLYDENDENDFDKQRRKWQRQGTAYVPPKKPGGKN